MTVNNELISHLEKLARLQLSDVEKNKLSADLGKILNMVDKLRELKTEGVEPLIWMNEETPTMREDVVKNQITAAQALQNAPDHDGKYFRTPKVVDSGK